MQPPRFRFSVRALMLAVLVVALSIESTRLAGLSSRYRETATLHAHYVRSYTKALDNLKSLLGGSQAERDDLLNGVRRVREHHARLEEKYAHAAGCPWLSIDTDPPEPRSNVVISTCPL